MTDAIPKSSSVQPSKPSASAFNYPWAAAPDIIRANQKDAHFQSVLLTHLSSVIRSLYGTRTEHKWNNEASVFTELLYLSLTTLVGNRTLGEEYCDVVQVCADTHTLPSLTQRSGYILSSVLLPYFLSRLLPALRRRLRAKLERTLVRTHRRRVSSPTRVKQPPDRETQVQSYVLKHLDTLTSPAPIYAVSLAVFYFGGAYYQISKRLWRLRYIFTRALDASDERAGYEVLGVLLVVQMAVQSYLHLHQTYRQHQAQQTPHVVAAPDVLQTNPSDGPGGDDAVVFPTSAAENPFSAQLLFEAPSHGTTDPEIIRRRVARMTHTPHPSSGGAGAVAADAGAAGGRDGDDDDDGESEHQYRYHLTNDEVMRWMGETPQARKCTLCLEALKDPSTTTCGHVFCWTCVTDWLREQPMCPLCRQPALAQHVLPLRG